MLLKSEKRTSAEVAQQLGCNEVTVNVWLKRYEEGGLEGLQMLSGRGRKPILGEADLEKVKEVVAEHRQMSDWGLIDLYYADECRVSLEPVVPLCLAVC